LPVRRVQADPNRRKKRMGSLRLLRTGVGAAVAALLAACGSGGNPAAPSAPPAQPPPAVIALPAGATLAFMSGISQEPVGSARVSVGNTAYTTDGAGQIRLGEPAEAGASLSVEAAGFLRRDTLIRSSSDTLFTLWPLEGATGEYTAMLVYDVRAQLKRLHATTQRVSVVPNLAFVTTDPTGLAAHEYAAERITAATAGQVEFVVEERPSGSVVVQSELAPDPCPGSWVACFELRLEGGYIVSAVIKISSERTSPDGRPAVILHELGHVFGLNHSPESSTRDVMSAAPTSATDFSPSEIRSMRMMLQRLAGGVFPDDDTRVGAAPASSSGRELIVCGP
jgi:hypothetical protein